MTDLTMSNTVSSSGTWGNWSSNFSSNLFSGDSGSWATNGSSTFVNTTSMYTWSSDDIVSGGDDDDISLFSIMDDMVEFGECTDSMVVTCDSGVLNQAQYNTDTCTGTANETITSSHDECYFTTLSLGCSTTGEYYCALAVLL